RLQGAGVSAGGSVRSYRGGGRVRGRVPRAPRAHRRRVGGEREAGDGIRGGDGIVRGRGVRRPALRARDGAGRGGARTGVPLAGVVRRHQGGAMTDRYAAAGVRLDDAEEAKRRIGELARATRTPLALGNIGAFGGMVRVPPGMRKPVLVLSTDGVGTKVLVAIRAGVHDTNGYSLARRIIFDTMKLDLGDPFPDDGRSVAQVLLAVHVSYAAAVMPVIPRLHALAHITGGGIPGNLIRVLPDGCEAVVDAG